MNPIILVAETGSDLTPELASPVSYTHLTLPTTGVV